MRLVRFGGRSANDLKIRNACGLYGIQSVQVIRPMRGPLEQDRWRSVFCGCHYAIVLAQARYRIMTRSLSTGASNTTALRKIGPVSSMDNTAEANAPARGVATPRRRRARGAIALTVAKHPHPVPS